MTQQEQFLDILDKERIDDLYSFLQELNPKDKKDLLAPFKKIAKDYLEYKEVRTATITGSSSSFSRKASPLQSVILSLAGFVLLSRQDFDRITLGSSLLGDRRIFNILAWFQPTWFNDYLNSYANAEYFPYYLSYLWLIELQENGYAAPTPELLAKALPDVIFEQKKDYRYWIYKPEYLTKYPITMEEHIWYLFQYDSNLHYSDRFIQIKKEDEGQKVTWIDTFKEFAEQGKIDRNRLLREAIGATTKGFNKVLTGWFAELFIKLEPTTAELVPLQDHLLNALNSQQSKPVNAVLTYFKKLAEEPEFKVADFLDHSALLFSSETKSVVTATLAILEKLAKRYPDLRFTIVLLSSQAFIHNDEAIQLRAAKLIQKYGESGSEELAASLDPYETNLLSNSRALLQEFLLSSYQEEASDMDAEGGDLEPVLGEQNALPVIHNFDELVYLASQSFDNNAAYHIDLLPATLLQYKSEIRGENINKLAPAFQRAYTMLVADFTSSMGYLDHLLATFFINYAIHLINTYPAESTELQKIHETYLKKDQELNQKWSWRGLRLWELGVWQAFKGDTLCVPYKKLLLLTLEKLQVKDELPLLSTPTHLPSWVSPFTLIDRIYAYQKAEVTPEEIDFQMALARVKLENTDAAIIYAESKLTGEYLSLVKFLLEANARPFGPFKNETWWLVAALTKNPGVEYEEFVSFSINKKPRHFVTGQFPWKSFEEHYTIDRYDYATKKSIKVPATRKVFRVELGVHNELSKVQGFLAKFLPTKKQKNLLLYEYLAIKSRYLSAEYNDIERLLLMTPNNPEPLLGHISRKSLQYSTFWEEGDRRLVTKSVETILQIWQKLGTMAHVFVATCMLSSDKTIRAFAAEIWLKGVSERTIQNELLGEVLGIHESIEFAPLKRFTDLAMSNMFKVSKTHNQALEKVLNSLLLQLPSEPIKNLKALLQIYQEVLAVNGTSVNDTKLLEKITTWQRSATLTKIAKSLTSKAVLV